MVAIGRWLCWTLELLSPIREDDAYENIVSRAYGPWLCAWCEPQGGGVFVLALVRALGQKVSE